MSESQLLLSSVEDLAILPSVRVNSNQAIGDILAIAGGGINVSRTSPRFKHQLCFAVHGTCRTVGYPWDGVGRGRSALGLDTPKDRLESIICKSSPSID
jgi:hypothetical protein